MKNFLTHPVPLGVKAQSPQQGASTLFGFYLGHFFREQIESFVRSQKPNLFAHGELFLQNLDTLDHGVCFFLFLPGLVFPANSSSPSLCPVR